MRNLDQEDINDIKVIAEEIQQIALKFDYHDERVATLCYDIDMSMRAILEIINGPSGTVERMI
jgi:ParB-like chromosome segregation protein Spo0J